MRSTVLTWALTLALAPAWAGVAPSTFNSVVVHSGTKLIAKLGQHEPLDVPTTLLHINDQTLHVHSKGSIAMHIPYTIERIVLEHGAEAYFDQIKTHDLTLVNKGSGRLVVHTQNASVKTIRNEAQGTIDVYAIQSPKLTITSLQGTLHLAGKVKHLYAKLTGKSLLNGKHLQAYHAWVRTQEEAAALVHPLSTLNAYAIGNSQIAYNHRLPNDNALIETHGRGNVFYVEHPTLPALSNQPLELQQLHALNKKKGGKFA